MRLLHFADLHLDTPFRWAPPDVARARRRALRETLTRICRLADELNVDALTCGGDLYEQDRFTPDTAAFLRSAFTQVEPLPVFIAPGNHDWYGPASLYRQVDWPPNVHVFTEDRLSPVELADGLTMWGAAHRAPAEVDLRLQDVASLPVPQLDSPLLPRLGQISVGYDFDRLKDEQTVRGQFLRDALDDGELSDDQRRRVLVTGLWALDGRRDELEVH
jgi:3',5'-cyclic AMP phosphodiesterase CpdA